MSSSPTRIFVTGATGYIGGSTLNAIVQNHPEYSIRALVRDTDKASKLEAKHPNITTVLGDLDSTGLLQEEAYKANIVLHCADTDHVQSAKAIVKGLSSHPEGETVHFIHTSGSGILYDLSKPETTGRAPSVNDYYSDIRDIERLIDLLEGTHIHKNVDNIVLAAANHVRTAIVAPPAIYGTGSGLNRRSLQVPNLIKLFITREEAFCVGEGKNLWNNVHVEDLAQLYLKLIEAAASGGVTADWKVQAYYFAENGEHSWGDISAALAVKLSQRKLMKSTEVRHLAQVEVDQVTPYGSMIWGSNSLGKAERSRKGLGWSPKHSSREDLETLDEAIEHELKLLKAEA